MAVDDHEGLVIAVGAFGYDGAAPMEIRIIGQNFDHYYAMTQDDELEPGKLPTPLGENGLLYRVVPGGSPLFQTVRAAKEWANEQPWGPVRWNDDG